MAIIGARQTALHEHLIRIGSPAHIASGVADIGRKDGAIKAQNKSFHHSTYCWKLWAGFVSQITIKHPALL
jgi:hypothetical protein